MSAALGSLVVSLEANMAKFTSDMGKAAYQTERAMQQMQRSSEATKAAIVGLAQGALAAFSVSAFVGFVKGTIDAADGVNDLSQRVGIAVADLAKYQLAANQSGTTMEALAKGIKGVAVNLAEHGKELAAAGITATTSDGAMRQLADVFANMPDGMEKTTLAVKLFGKSGMDLIPMLNMGSAGLDSAAEKSAKYAAVLAALAPQADAFNDNMAELAMYSKITGMSMVNDLMPALVSITKAMADAAQKGGMLKGIMAGLDEFGNRAFDWNGNAQRKGIANLKADLEQLHGEQNALTIDVFGKKGQIQADIEAKTTALNAAVKAYYGMKDGNAGRGTVNPASVKPTVDWMADYKAMMAALGAGPKADKAPKKSDAQKLEEDAQRFVARLREQAETFGKSGVAALEYQMSLSKFPQIYKDEAIALQTKIDALKANEEAQKAAIKADIAGFEAMDKLRQADDAAGKANAADVERIRTGLMNPADQEAQAHELVLAELQKFHDRKFENVEMANALIEGENERHRQVLVDMQAQRDMDSLAMMGSTADQIYDLMKKSGQEQTALGKAVFLATKAIRVAEIIMNTEAAAQAAMVTTGWFGIPMATYIRVSGYASAGMVAGMAIADASAEGGYDIPAGKNPITQLHEKEMVLPKAQADVIRGLASNGGSGGGSGFNLTLVTNGTPQRVVDSQRISDSEYTMLLEDASNLAVKKTIASISDSNGKTGRAIRDSFGLQRSRQ